jgi:hypothetical protein
VPIDGYDDLSVGEVGKKIKGHSKDEIEAVRSYEKNNKNRKTLLERIDSNSRRSSPGGEEASPRK